MWQSFKDKVKALWVKSWSKFWGRLQVFVGVVALGWHAALPYLSEMLNNADVKLALEALKLPVGVALGLAILGVITLIARSHQS